MSNRGRKGGAYEREICVRLSRWWSRNANDDLFWRTAGSGARATNRGKKRTHGHYGDICATHPSAEPLIDVCTIEIKNGYTTKTVADLFDLSPTRAQKTWEEWIWKAERSSEQAGSFAWMLITHRNFCEPMLTMPLRLFGELSNYDKFGPANTPPSWMATARVRDKKKKSYKTVTLCGMLFESFLRHTDPKWFIELSERL